MAFTPDLLTQTLRKYTYKTILDNKKYMQKKHKKEANSFFQDTYLIPLKESGLVFSTEINV